MGQLKAGFLKGAPKGMRSVPIMEPDQERQNPLQARRRRRWRTLDCNGFWMMSYAAGGVAEAMRARRLRVPYHGHTRTRFGDEAVRYHGYQPVGAWFSCLFFPPSFLLPAL